MIRTFPLGTTGPRRQPTLLGFIRHVELELKTATPRPRPHPVPPLNGRPALPPSQTKSPAEWPGFFVFAG